MSAPCRPRAAAAGATTPAARALARVGAGGRAVWVRVEAVSGSAPREAGASMWVDAGGRVDGTIGGGRLEHDAVAVACRLLAEGGRARVHTIALGPSLGQCCGGSVQLSWRVADAAALPWLTSLAEVERAGGTLEVVTPVERADGSTQELRSRVVHRPWQVWVFGAGHVGDALVRVLATLPLRLTWVDPRPAVFQADAPPGVVCVETDSPAHEVAGMPADADAVVLTHSHALDLDVCQRLLERDGTGFVGLIGSRTKAARFARRLALRGVAPGRLARLACPIGPLPVGRGALDRHPGAVALAIAGELLAHRRRADPLGGAPGEPTGAAPGASTGAAPATVAGRGA
jgi:xanthine dehydrogenase accessory factor